MFDTGLFVTALALVAAFVPQSDKATIERHARRSSILLRHVLLLNWLTVTLASLLSQPMPTMVFIAAMNDFIIACTGVVIGIRNPGRVDARAVGMISMALMPAHWWVSMRHGLPEWGWFIYALGQNIAFISQCLIAGGWMDGLGRAAVRFFSRLGPLPGFRGGGR